MPRKPLQSDFHNLIAELLSEQGVDVVNGVLEQLIHFSHAFVTQLRSTAQDLTSGSEAVTVDHIHLANDLRSFPQSRLQHQDIHKMATRVNSKPFPKIEPHQGLSLPNEEHCLLTNNFQYGKLDGGIVEKSESDGKKKRDRSEDVQVQNPTMKKKSVKRIENDDFSGLEAVLIAELEANTAAEIGENKITAKTNKVNKDEKEEKSLQHPSNLKGSSKLEEEKAKGSRGNKLKSHVDRSYAAERAAVSLDEENLPTDHKKSSDIV